MNLEEYEARARAGDREAMYRLGLEYWTRSPGRPRDVERSNYWHMQAALAGHAESMLWVGTRYEEGISFPHDMIEALKWYILAYRHGCRGAELAVALTQNVMKAEEVEEARRRADRWTPIELGAHRG